MNPGILKLAQQPGHYRRSRRGTNQVIYDHQRMLFSTAQFANSLLRYRLLQGNGDLARAVVNAGWNLSELAPVGSSLEEIFLQLTGTDRAAAEENLAPPPESQTAVEVQQ